MQMKHGVVMLVNEFPPLPVGGAERQAERLSEFLTAHGWPIIVLTRRIGNLPSYEDRNGIRIIRPTTVGPGKLRTVSFIAGTLFALWRYRDQYQILHAHLAFGPAFAAVIAARLLNKKVIVKFGTSGEFGDVRLSQKTWRGRLRLAVIRNWSDRIIALDEPMRSEAVSAGFESDRIIRMNNGIDAKRFVPAVSRIEDHVNVLYVGRLAAQKSLSTLIKALAIALPSCHRLRLTLVGEGELRPALEAEVSQLGLTPYVTFTGTQLDVRPFLDRADIFALPSAAEGISNALLEAMSAGVACLATPVGGNGEVLDHGRCGRLLPQGDEKAWSEALISLGNDRESRIQYGRAARQRILDTYDFATVGIQYEKLYEQLMSDSYGR